jgi:hypothetical protein
MAVEIISRQVQFPFLTNEIMAEAVVRLFLDKLKASLFVNAMCGSKNALRPENDLLIARCAREADTFVH